MVNQRPREALGLRAWTGSVFIALVLYVLRPADERADDALPPTAYRPPSVNSLRKPIRYGIFRCP